jgi:hypothetical protein
MESDKETMADEPASASSGKRSEWAGIAQVGKDPTSWLTQQPNPTLSTQCSGVARSSSRIEERHRAVSCPGVMRRQALLPWRNAGAGGLIAPAADENGLVWRVRLMLWITENKEHFDELVRELTRRIKFQQFGQVLDGMLNLEQGKDITAAYRAICAAREFYEPLKLLDEASVGHTLLEQLLAHSWLADGKGESISHVNKQLWDLWKPAPFTPKLPDTAPAELESIFTQLKERCDLSSQCGFKIQRSEDEPTAGTSEHLDQLGSSSPQPNRPEVEGVAQPGSVPAPEDAAPEKEFGQMWYDALRSLYQFWIRDREHWGTAWCKPECPTHFRPLVEAKKRFGYMDCCMFRTEGERQYFDMVVEYKKDHKEISKALAQALASVVAVLEPRSSPFDNHWVVLVGLAKSGATIARVCLTSHVPIETLSVELLSKPQYLDFLQYLLCALDHNTTSPVAASAAASSSTESASPKPLWSLNKRPVERDCGSSSDGNEPKEAEKGEIASAPKFGWKFAREGLDLKVTTSSGPSEQWPPLTQEDTVPEVRFECDPWFAQVTHAPPSPVWAASCEQVTFNILVTHQFASNNPRVRQHYCDRILGLIDQFPKATITIVQCKRQTIDLDELFEAIRGNRRTLHCLKEYKHQQ